MAVNKDNLNALSSEPRTVKEMTEYKQSSIMAYLTAYRNSLNPKVTYDMVAITFGNGTSAASIKAYERKSGSTTMDTAIKYAEAIGLKLVVSVPSRNITPQELYIPQSHNEPDPCAMIIRIAAKAGRTKPIQLSELAEKLGITNVGFSKIMNGKHLRMMKVWIFENLCAMLGITISYEKNSGSKAIKSAQRQVTAIKALKSFDYIPNGYNDGDKIEITFHSPEEVLDFIKKSMPIVIGGMKKVVFTSGRTKELTEYFLAQRFIKESINQQKITLESSFPDED
jgi:DNA-binding Xre family transcriptional regulator